MVLVCIREWEILCVCVNLILAVGGFWHVNLNEFCGNMDMAMCVVYSTGYKHGDVCGVRYLHGDVCGDVTSMVMCVMFVTRMVMCAVYVTSMVMCVVTL